MCNVDITIIQSNINRLPDINETIIVKKKEKQKEETPQKILVI